MQPHPHNETHPITSGSLEATGKTLPTAISQLHPAENRVLNIDRPAQETRASIAVIYTGGTIGMVASEKGLVPGDKMPERLLNLLQTLPESRLQALPNFDLLTLPRLIDSSNATPEDWLQLSQQVCTLSAHYRAFVILHGTDTLAYTASALSFLLPARLPCIITGSQYPLETKDGDALNNVEAALLTAQSLVIQPRQLSAGLIVFGGSILQGNRSSKVSTYSHQGFDSINQPALGSCSAGQLHWSTPYETAGYTESTADTAADFTPHKTEAEAGTMPPVVILKLWPGIQAQQIESLLAQPVRGVVLESYGSGNAPDLNQPLLKAFKAACDRGVVIVNRSQCPQGGVSMNYAAGSALADAGIISAHDMTCEAAFCKLSLLLRQYDAASEVRQAFKGNYRGELSV